MSDGTTTTTTHERLTETRSWSEYDEAGNVTADHTTVRAICGTCYRERIDRHGHLEYVSADWPCPEVENARLRERVAALDVMLGQACEAVNWLLDQDWPKDMDPGPGIRTDLAKWLAALAQAGEGGAA